MSEVKSKQFNHFISVTSIAIFCLSIVCLGIFGFILINNYQENVRLKEEYDKMQADQERIEEMSYKTDEDGYYNVYAEDELVIYDVGGTIIIK